MAKLIKYEENNGKYNMDLDSELLDYAIKNKEKEPIIRFYGWKPACVSIGRNQTFENINLEYCNRNNIDVVKRVTGGRALLHDDEVTYSFICPVDFLGCGNSVISSYKEISSAIIEGFKNIDIELTLGGKTKAETKHDYCMLISTGADLCYKDLKLIGSAQYRRDNYILQHGSVLFSYDKDKIEKIFNEEVKEKSITYINEINSSLTRRDIVNSMIQGFSSYFCMLYYQI